MTPDDSSLFNKRIRHLSQALIVSGALNIGVLSLLLYWTLRERPPTPYCELKPASFEQQQIPLADQRGCGEVLAQLSQLPFSQLISKLSHTQVVENGYAERDLALACLIAFHHFDILRALPKNSHPQQRRLLAWKPHEQERAITLVVYPDLNQQQFDSLIQFANTEQCPFNAEGLFLLLKEQKDKKPLNDHLVETFVLTPEFWTAELLFNRSGHHIDKQEILTLLLEGNWTILKQFTEQQRQLQDTSDARRQKFLLDYLKASSPCAAALLLKMEWEFAVKKLDDQQVITILQLIPPHLTESQRYAKEMLTSPRNVTVWKQAAQSLYSEAGESLPKKWSHQEVLARFVPEKTKIDLVSKPIVLTVLPALPLSHLKKTSKSAAIQTVSSQKSGSSQTLKEGKKGKSVQVVKMAEKKTSSIPSNLSDYNVQEGDSLWKIARRFGIKVEELKSRNHLKSETLKPGMILKISD